MKQHFSYARICCAFAVFVASATAQTVTVSVDGTVTGTPLQDVWTWHGYDEDNNTNTPASESVLHTIVSNSQDPVYIRTHFLLNNNSGAPGLKWGSTDVYTENAGVPVYNWKTLDSINDAIINGGAFPYFDFAFMPQALTSAPSNIPYRNSSVTALDGGCMYPPNNYTKWATLIDSLVQHCANRYPGSIQNWIWELWNEDDIGYWHGTAAAYDSLFDYTEHALHSVLPNATLSGPEMAGPGNIGPFLTHCATGKNAVTGATGTRLDQISFHAKGGTSYTSNGHVLMNLGNQLQIHLTGFKAVLAGPTQFRSNPIVIGEADPDGCAACPSNTTPADLYRSGPAYGAYEVAMMKHSLTLADSLGVHLRACLAWAWMFNGQPYFDGYRDLSTNGIDKPVLNAFKLLGRLRGNRVTVQSSGALGLSAILANGVHGSKPDIDGMATVTDSLLQFLMWNYHDSLEIVPPAQVNLTIKVPSSFPPQVMVTHWRVDTTTSNAYTKWLTLGSPQNPTAAQLDTLYAAMQLQTLTPPQLMTVVNGQISLSFSLPRFGLSLIEVSTSQTAGVVPSSSTVSQKISLHESTLEVNLKGAYMVKIFDVSGRQVFSANGTGPGNMELPKQFLQGKYRVEVQNSGTVFSRWTSGD